jgi:hypothetical protein
VKERRYGIEAARRRPFTTVRIKLGSRADRSS